MLRESPILFLFHRITCFPYEKRICSLLKAETQQKRRRKAQNPGNSLIPFSVAAFFNGRTETCIGLGLWRNLKILLSTLYFYTAFFQHFRIVNASKSLCLFDSLLLSRILEQTDTYKLLKIQIYHFPLSIKFRETSLGFLFHHSFSSD